MELIGDTLIVLGSAFMLLGGIGVVRFTDVYARMHAAAKAPALGMLLIVIGAGLDLRSTKGWAHLALVMSTLIITGPISAHITARAVHDRQPFDIDVVDELAEAEAKSEDT